MAILDTLMLDLDRATSGEWFHYRDGFEVRIVSTSTLDFSQAERDAIRPFTEVSRAGKLTQEMRRNISLELLARHAIVDWRGLTDKEGQVIIYTPERALDLLRDPRLFPFLQWVERVAANDANFAARVIEDSVGNSGGVSAGGSSSAETQG
jgi:hypothetical protein